MGKLKYVKNIYHSKASSFETQNNMEVGFGEGKSSVGQVLKY